MRSQCDRCCLRFMPVLMDRAARSPSIKKGSALGSARANAPSAVPHGNLPCGAALAHWPLLDSNCMGAHTAMCAGGVLVRRNVHASGGLCVFLAPYTWDTAFLSRGTPPQRGGGRSSNASKCQRSGQRRSETARRPHSADTKADGCAN